MAVTGQFRLIEYKLNTAGVMELHFENTNPGPGNPTDFYVGIPEPELPTNLSQTQLGNTLKKYLGLALNNTHGPMNTFIANATVVTLP